MKIVLYQNLSCSLCQLLCDLRFSGKRSLKDNKQKIECKDVRLEWNVKLVNCQTEIETKAKQNLKQDKQELICIAIPRELNN